MPAEAAAAARDTLGGAVSVAAELPGPTLGAGSSTWRREAFVAGLQLTAGDRRRARRRRWPSSAFTALRHVQPADHAQAAEGATEEAGDAVVVDLTDELADCAADPVNCAAA